MYPHPQKQILCLVHGDDFVSVGCLRQLQRFKKRLKGRFEIKTTTVGSRESEGEVKETRILKRIIRIAKDGWEYEADQRDGDLIIQETGASKMSTLTHPGGDKKVMEEEEKSAALVGTEATRY